MKLIILTLVTALLITGCGIGNTTYNTSYKINENAEIDHFIIKCTNYELINEYNNQKPKNGIFLKVNYNITNKNKNPIIINPEKYFKLYRNDSYIAAIGEDKQLTQNKLEEYSVVFDTSIEDSYKILFYSNVVSNNVAFELK